MWRAQRQGLGRAGKGTVVMVGATALKDSGAGEATCWEHFGEGTPRIEVPRRVGEAGRQPQAGVEMGLRGGSPEVASCSENESIKPSIWFGSQSGLRPSVAHMGCPADHLLWLRPVFTPP